MFINALFLPFLASSNCRCNWSAIEDYIASCIMLDLAAVDCKIGGNFLNIFLPVLFALDVVKGLLTGK